MKKRTRILSLLLAVVLSASALVGCENDTKTTGEVKEQKKQNVKAEIPATEYDLVSAGSSKYFILIPENPTECEP